MYLEQGILVESRHSDGYMVRNVRFICKMSDSFTRDGGKSAQARSKRQSTVDG